VPQDTLMEETIINELLARFIVLGLLVILSIVCILTFRDYYTSEGVSFNTVVAGMTIFFSISASISLLILTLIKMSDEKERRLKKGGQK
jgi:hypothetical protein